MFFDSNKPYLSDHLERHGFVDLGRVMIWLCLLGFWLAVGYVVLA